MGRVSHHIKPTAFGMGLIALDLVLSADPKEAYLLLGLVVLAVMS